VHVENHELKEYAFVHNVMRPLIGPSYVHPGVSPHTTHTTRHDTTRHDTTRHDTTRHDSHGAPPHATHDTHGTTCGVIEGCFGGRGQVPIVMTPAFLGALGAGVEQSRPELRRKDTEIDVDSKFAFLMPDLSLLPHAAPAADADATDGRVAPIICVEIKVRRPTLHTLAVAHTVSRACRACRVVCRVSCRAAKVGLPALFAVDSGAAQHQDARVSLLHAPTTQAQEGRDRRDQVPPVCVCDRACAVTLTWCACACAVWVVVRTVR
jgi:hypothetical protein